MNQNTKTAPVDDAEVVQDFNTAYSNKVHVIGRSTMAIALSSRFFPFSFSIL